MTFVLTVIQGPEKGRRFELPPNEPQFIGRSSEALPLRDQTISRRHAELTPDDGKWFLRDLASTNGTFVNGIRINGRYQLKVGDQIRTGGSLLLYGESEDKRREGLYLVDRSADEISLGGEVPANDDSMVMAVPEPAQAAQFQLKVLYELTQLIGSAADHDELLERVMEVVLEYFEADHGAILLAESPDQEPDPCVLHQRQRPRQAGPPAKVPISRTIVRYALEKQVGVLSSNAMSDQRFTAGESVHSLGIRSVLCAPMKFKDRLFGVLYLDSHLANYTYTDDQLRLLTAIGLQTGLALANAEIYHQRLQRERLAVVGETVATLSHSIKNILQGLRGGVDLVELGLKKDQPKLIRNGWKVVANNLDRIYELTMNMLAFSKQRHAELEMTNLSTLLAEIVDLAHKQFDNKEVALLTDFDEDMPAVPIDAGGIHQSVLNLLSNACDAVEPKIGAVTLISAYDPKRQTVRIEVRDNGCGISPANRNRMFEPFFSTKGLKGTGLGLVVTRKIVQEHDGRLDIETKPGEGTTFTITLPCHADRLHAPGDTQGPTAGSPHAPSLKTLE